MLPTRASADSPAWFRSWAARPGSAELGAISATTVAVVIIATTARSLRARTTFLCPRRTTAFTDPPLLLPAGPPPPADPRGSGYGRSPAVAIARRSHFRPL